MEKIVRLVDNRKTVDQQCHLSPVTEIVHHCIEDHLGAYTNATVTRRQQYRKIRGRRTRLLRGLVLPAQAILLEFLIVPGGGERTYEYATHERRTIKTWPTHKSFAQNIGSEPEGLF